MYVHVAVVASNIRIAMIEINLFLICFPTARLRVYVYDRPETIHRSCAHPGQWLLFRDGKQYFIILRAAPPCGFRVDQV